MREFCVIPCVSDEYDIRCGFEYSHDDICLLIDDDYSTHEVMDCVSSVFIVWCSIFYFELRTQCILLDGLLSINFFLIHAIIHDTRINMNILNWWNWITVDNGLLFYFIHTH